MATTTKSILKNSIDSSQEDQSRKTSVGSSDGDDNTSRRSSILSASGMSMLQWHSVDIPGFFCHSDFMWNWYCGF